MEIPTFQGGWSYTQREMNDLFKHIQYKDNYSILEFGAGDSSTKLFNHFKKYTKILHYSIFESNFTFLPKNLNDFQVNFYDESDIETVQMPDRTYDLVLIDGPNGDKRKFWYSKIKRCVKEGTILLVDDFNHFQSFSDELDRNFHYEVLEHHDEPFVAYGEHSWKIVRIIHVKN